MLQTIRNLISGSQDTAEFTNEELARIAINHYKNLKAQTAYGRDSIANAALKNQESIVREALAQVTDKNEYRALLAHLRA